MKIGQNYAVKRKKGRGPKCFQNMLDHIKNLHFSSHCEEDFLLWLYMPGLQLEAV